MYKKDIDIFKFLKKQVEKKNDNLPNILPNIPRDNTVPPVVPHIPTVTNEDDSTISATKEFDLNIEKILDSWEVYHAVREVIANALDEQILTNTPEIAIRHSFDGWWHVIDYGRGLNYHHLTQNENEEKLQNDFLIGRFGVGLKDALATFYRHDVKVKISSKYGVITLTEAKKEGFEDIITLHAVIEPPQNSNMVGTDFAMYGITKNDMDKAKGLFLKFNNETVLERNEYGDVIAKASDISNIYINGIKVAEEPNFLFSYNITSINKQIKKALNRERTNVGRTAYTSRVKDILKSCKRESVIAPLIDDLQSYQNGMMHDELGWNDVALYASIQMQQINDKVVFVNSNETLNNYSIIDSMKKDGYTPILLNDKILYKINDYNRNLGDDADRLVTSSVFLQKQQDNFVPIKIAEWAMTRQEKLVYQQTNNILNLIGGKPKNIRNIYIVDKIYDSDSAYETVGLYRPELNEILICRSQLASLSAYAGTLLHECIHASSGYGDVSREFEIALTDTLGKLAKKIL